MRMLNDINEVLSVEEVTWLDASPVWDPRDKNDYSNPDYFIVSVMYSGRDEDEVIGEYDLDGNPETFRKALENFNMICVQATERGFFRLTDFTNFKMV